MARPVKEPPTITINPTSIPVGRLRVVAVNGQNFRQKVVHVGPKDGPSWGFAEPVHGGFSVTEEVLASEAGGLNIVATDEDGTVLASAILTITPQ